MSFILDALRKSETERQRQAGPGLVDAGYRPPAARRGIWLPLLVVVLVANLAAIALFWWRRPATAPPPAQATAAMPAQPSPGGAAAPSAAGAGPAADVTTPAAAVAAGDSEAAYAATADMPALETQGGGVTEVLEPPAAAPAQPAGQGVIQEGLPSADDLIASGALAVPAMHLDIHVYTPDPAGRFVFINMRKYTEGAVLTEGPRLEEITREGAVLSHNGRRFVINRD